MWDQLIEDPLGFGSLYAIRAATGTVPKSKEVGEHRSGNSTIKQYDVESTPYYCEDIASDNNCVTFTVDPGGDKKKGCYYLPWGGDRAYRMRLESETIPRVFFTAALDGCSVVVEGNVMLPSVYHANAAGTLPKQSPIGDTSCLEKIALGVISKRNEVMFGACAAFPANKNAWHLQHKSDFPDLVKSAAAVTALEYGVLIGRQSANQELRAAMTQPVVAKQLLNSKKFVQSSGSVFGVLDNDERWHFYMQRVVELDNGEFAVLRCVEFWPTGFSRSLDNP